MSVSTHASVSSGTDTLYNIHKPLEFVVLVGGYNWYENLDYDWLIDILSGVYLLA